MIEVEEARRLVLEPIEPLGAESVPLGAAFRRVLAAPVISREAAPPFDRAEMDGYAVRSGEVAGASEAKPVVLEVAIEITAGSLPGAQLRPGTAARIMTGAPVPAGADAVIPREWTREAPRQVSILRPSGGPGSFVGPRGEDFAEGEVLLAAGTRLHAAALALAAAAGVDPVWCRRRPRVAILSTGDELVPAGAPLRPGAIHETNRLLLSALVEAAGGVPVDCGLARDEERDLEEKLGEALRADAVITTGGVSVGDRDLVRATLARLGVESRFWRVAVRPGKPLAYGLFRGRPVFGLPGNPASVLVTFHLFAGPAILRLQGCERVEPPAFEAILEEPVAGPPDRRGYFRGRLRADGNALRVRLAGSQSSACLRSLAGANALVVVPAGARLDAGARVRVEPLDWPDPEARPAGPAGEAAQLGPGARGAPGGAEERPAEGRRCCSP